MSGRYVIGADVGTTGTKSMLISEEGKILRRAYRGYPLLRENGCITQRAEDWYTALCETVREILGDIAPESVEAICLSTQGGSLVWADEAFEPICPAVSWMDGRDEKEFAAIAAKNTDFRAITGWKLGGWGTVAKLHIWSDRGARWIFSTVDWLNAKLTGRAAIDPSNAAMQLMYNVLGQDWDDTLVEYAGIRKTQLPEIVPSGEPVGTLTKKVAADLGLTEKTVLLSGGHDQYCAAYGSGVREEGDMILSGGTSWVSLAFSGSVPDHASWGRHLTEPLYGALTSIGTAGASMEWACRLGGYTLQEANEAAFAVKDAPIFVPGFGKGGARLSGLEMDHGAGAVVRAVMEGVAFEERCIADTYGELKNIYVNGGASKSELWMQILADALGRAVTVIHEKDMACLGAGRLAARFAGIGTADAFTSHTVEPKADVSEKYARYLEVRNG